MKRIFTTAITSLLVGLLWVSATQAGPLLYLQQLFGMGTVVTAQDANEPRPAGVGYQRGYCEPGPQPHPHLTAQSEDGTSANFRRMMKNGK